MRFLVFSDSHGQIRNMQRVIEKNRGDFDAVLHLGDGAKEVLLLRRMYPDIKIHAVLGNCDGFDYMDYDIRQELLLPSGDKTLFLCHGDRFFVQYSLSTLSGYARRKGADIALYGHLHSAHEEYIPPNDDIPDSKPFWIFSPGSISSPRDGLPSFGILDIVDAGVLFSVGRLKY